MSNSTFPTGTWTLGPDTSVALSLKKMKVITVNATVQLTEGSVTVGDDGQVDAVAASLDAASFASGNDKRDEHVRSDDFLDTDGHPAIGFASSAIDATADGHRVAGELTIKGQAFPVSLEVGDVVVDGDEGTFRATAIIDRTSVGVAKFPSLVIAKMIDVEIAGRASLAA